MASPAEGSTARLLDNAFLVLGLTPRAKWPDVARVAETLIAALEAGDPAAEHYETPLGPRRRTVARVWRARAQLRDPDERIHHEIWWEAPVRGVDQPAEASEAWPKASAAWGWRAR